VLAYTIAAQTADVTDSKQQERAVFLPRESANSRSLVERLPDPAPRVIAIQKPAIDIGPEHRLIGRIPHRLLAEPASRVCGQLQIGS
jgi:hypothetical protein